MASKSAIEWTDATWNPVTGCSKVSPGCAHCYAETMATTRLVGKPGYVGLPWTPENASLNVVLRPERLNLPRTWREPRRVFVNSMSDLFQELVPVEFIAQVFTTMALTPQHTYQVLTKRPERMAAVMGSVAAEALWSEWPLPNVWLGTSIENDRFVGRADDLRRVPGEWIRFLSCEPLLGPLPSLDLTDLDWVIVGGESGPGARPMHSDWVRDLRDRCRAAGVAFFFKQWGAWARGSGFRDEYSVMARSGRVVVAENVEGAFRGSDTPTLHLEAIHHSTKRNAGRELDGRTWDEYPRAAA
jgi:protein gp37